MNDAGGGDGARGAGFLALTMGDPCGIGPETIAKAAAAGALGPAVVVGVADVLRRAAIHARADLEIVEVDAPENACALASARGAACVAVWTPDALRGSATAVAALPMGRVDARAGAAAAACIDAGAALALAGRVDALVTAPIHKEAFAAAGVDFPGHTEMLQAAAGGVPVRMMLANGELRVVLATIHVALRRAIELIDEPRVFETIRLADAALRRAGVRRPRIAVAGLNPHAGEGGLFGDEERRHIAPAIARARGFGVDASGPHPPDTVFMRARNAPGHPGAFDAVVAMTHDHGLIPVKYLGVEHGVNATIGLPFVRTSPDHGTAFDIAGRGVADARSLVAAIAFARETASPGHATSGAAPR